MAISSDQGTRATRLAANAAALSVVLYAMLWVLTTQVTAIRVISPFAEDPWDAVASYASIVLPVVAGATWIRSLRHRGPVLEAATGRRIRWGAALAAATVLAASGADAVAIRSVGLVGAGAPGPLIAGLVTLSGTTAAVALLLIVRAARTGVGSSAAGGPAPSAPGGARAAIAVEPDVVDDALALAVELAHPLHLDGPVARLAATIDRMLETSPLSPRRHRLATGPVLAAVGGLAFAGWHAIREGPPPSIAVPIAFAILFGAGVLAVWLGTVVPLRLLRPPRA
jgi:hypothetical protein